MCDLGQLDDALTQAGYKTYSSYSDLYKEQRLSCGGFMVNDRGETWSYISSTKVDWKLMGIIARHVSPTPDIGRIGIDIENAISRAERAFEYERPGGGSRTYYETDANEAAGNVLAVLHQYWPLDVPKDEVP